MDKKDTGNRGKKATRHPKYMHPKWSQGLADAKSSLLPWTLGTVAAIRARRPTAGFRQNISAPRCADQKLKSRITARGLPSTLLGALLLVLERRIRRRPIFMCTRLIKNGYLLKSRYSREAVRQYQVVSVEFVCTGPLVPRTPVLLTPPLVTEA